jgi:hypothetical protein
MSVLVKLVEKAMDFYTYHPTISIEFMENNQKILRKISKKQMKKNHLRSKRISKEKVKKKAEKVKEDDYG